MAGKPGKSGGARPGAGRPRGSTSKKAAQKSNGQAASPNDDDPAPLPVTEEPLTFLLAVQNDARVDIKQRIRASIAAAQYKHTKRGDGGKKDEAAEKAEKAANKYAPGRQPLKVVRS